MDLTAVTVVALLVITVAVTLFAVIRALMDGQRGWAIGIAICTAVVAPVGVVLAITYVTNIRTKLDR